MKQMINGGTYCLAWSRDAYVTFTTAVSLSVFTGRGEKSIFNYLIKPFLIVCFFTVKTVTVEKTKPFLLRNIVNVKLY